MLRKFQMDYVAIQADMDVDVQQRNRFYQLYRS